MIGYGTWGIGHGELVISNPLALYQNDSSLSSLPLRSLGPRKVKSFRNNRKRYNL
jgi:hypothetical protein